jgi:hypothetical protein
MTKSGRWAVERRRFSFDRLDWVPGVSEFPASLAGMYHNQSFGCLGSGYPGLEILPDPRLQLMPSWIRQRKC